MVSFLCCVGGGRVLFAVVLFDLECDATAKTIFFLFLLIAISINFLDSNPLLLCGSYVFMLHIDFFTV